MDSNKNKGYYFIAEIGVNYYDIAVKNHISLMDAAKLMCREAKGADLDAVKFQSYRAETLAAKTSPAYWDTTEEATQSQYELFKKYDLFQKKEYEELAAYCKEIGIEFLSTPFDYEAADYLEPLVNCYKISSSDLNNLPFVQYLAQKRKPILLSTGAATEEEVKKAVETIRLYNKEPLVLLHCVLEYPTPPAHASLNRILSLKSAFPDVIVGYSDHTKPDEDYTILQTAFNLGAVVIEKHFTLDKSIQGNDHYHAMDERDALGIRKKFAYLSTIRGEYGLDYRDTEELSRKYARRSIVAAAEIKKGSVITKEAVILKRPGTGIPPEQLGSVIGKCASKDIQSDQIITWNDIS